MTVDEVRMLAARMSGGRDEFEVLREIESRLESGWSLEDTEHMLRILGEPRAHARD